MAHSVSAYSKALLRLLPTGRAWYKGPDGAWWEVLSGFAPECVRIDEQLELLIRERNTETTSALLSEFENELGLPDDCTEGELGTDIERRARIRAKIARVGSMTPAYYIELAADMGYTITSIDTFRPFWCGVGRSGDEIGPQSNLFVWRVNVLSTGLITRFLSGSGRSGDPLVEVTEIGPLICTLNKYKPAHTRLIYQIVGPAFSMAFSRAFDSMPSDDPAHLEGDFSRAFSSAFSVAHGGDYSEAYSSAFRKPA